MEVPVETGAEIQRIKSCAMGSTGADVLMVIDVNLTIGAVCVPSTATEHTIVEK